MITTRRLLMALMIISVSIFIGCEATSVGTAVNTESGLSSDYYIKSLTVSEGTLKYPFNSDDWINYIEVPFTTESITITAESNQEWASLYIGDEKLENNKSSKPIPLPVGKKIIEIKVVAENNDEFIYTIEVTRCSENYSNAKLSALTIDGAILSPLFIPEDSNRVYSVQVALPTISLHAVPIAEADGASVVITANNVKITDPAAINLNIGANLIKIISTAPDKKTEEIYTINISRQNDANNCSNLIDLSIAGGSLNPAFSSAITNYSIDVTSTMNPVNLTAIPESTKASVAATLNDAPVTKLSSILLVQGTESTIKVIVTAGDSTKTTYTINAKCLAGGSNADLSDIKVMMGTKSFRPLYPGTIKDHNPNNTGFDKTKTDYVTVIYGFDSITISATADDISAKSIQFTADGTSVTSTLTGGIGTATVPLKYGLVTEIAITTLADDGGTTKTYKVYAKLLNADEFYWGIYALSYDKSKKSWGSAAPNLTKDLKGKVGGDGTWIIKNMSSTITLNNYNDGKLELIYNDNGLCLNGIQEKPSSEDYNTTKSGTIFYVRTSAGEDVATLDYHIKVQTGVPQEGADSYTSITYMKDINHKQIYKNSKPFPWKNTGGDDPYGLSTDWKDGQ